MEHRGLRVLDSSVLAGEMAVELVNTGEKFNAAHSDRFTCGTVTVSVYNSGRPNPNAEKAIMSARSDRLALPKAGDRLRLGSTGLRVSPICLGMTGSPACVQAAFEAGVNFFFVSADLHWPLYEETRKGLERLLKGNPRMRDKIVVGIVSYFEQPWFGYGTQFWDAVNAVRGLKRADLLIAGGVSSGWSFDERLPTLQAAKGERYLGARAIGASLHQRTLAVRAEKSRAVDISYIRYNAAHPGARRDVLPYLRKKRRTLLFNFKSVLWPLPSRKLLGLTASDWLPEPTDYYRFVLSAPEFDGLLCSPWTPREVRALACALDKGPLSREEQERLLRLCAGVDANKDW